ncbi:MAG: hypothetical protein LBP99_06260 [Azoarcus sp.]|jgi:hypothetical protein|nr:hypothetical protein [Azoarcus sp.]
MEAPHLVRALRKAGMQSSRKPSVNVQLKEDDMFSSRFFHPRLMEGIFSRTFITLDIIGLILIFFPAPFFSSSGSWESTLTLVGTTFLTMGISLPIAIFFQEELNKASFSLINNCAESGIKEIFPSRETHGADFHEAVGNAASSSYNADFLGVAFRNLFDPNQTQDHRIERIRNRLTSPHVKLRILLLDAKSEAAQLRDRIEGGGTIIENIRTANLKIIPTLVHRRINEKIERDRDYRKIVDAVLKSDKESSIADPDNYEVQTVLESVKKSAVAGLVQDEVEAVLESVKKIATAGLGKTEVGSVLEIIKKSTEIGLDKNEVEAVQKFVKKIADYYLFKELELGVNVRLYKHDPIMFMMLFDGSLFAEQYHFGRPHGPHGRSCIGGHVPVIHFSRAAKAYNFLSAHFEHVWETSKDISSYVVRAGLLEYEKEKNLTF